MYRLVNVSMNPFGRFGAPETEPGPLGVGSWVDDEGMRVSFHKSLPLPTWRSQFEHTQTKRRAPL
jgi:hypothetical protein